MRSEARVALGERRRERLADMAEAMAQLQRHIDVDLRLSLTIPTSDMRSTERFWHDRFADKRKTGEWFALSTGDVDEMAIAAEEES